MERRKSKRSKKAPEGHKACNSRVGQETRGRNGPDAEVPRVEVKLVAQLMAIL